MIPLRTLTRYVLFIFNAALVVACDNADTESTAPDATFQLQPATAPAWREVTASSEKIVGGGGLNLSIYEAGQPGAPSVVFIHGFSQNFTTWDSQFRGLAESLHVMAYDFRGHGASDKPLEAAQYTQSSLWADDLDAVIRARNLQRPVLVGWSYGGYVIADYVRKFGDAGLGGLVFLASVSENGTEKARDFLTKDVLAIFGDVLSADVRSSLAGTHSLISLLAQHGSEQWETAFGSAMMVPPPVRLAMFSRLLENDDVLASIRVPTLVVHGANDRIAKLSASEHIARTVPGAKLLVYPGVGHAPHLEIGPRFNRDLAAFVRSIQ